jgi:UDP-N-acetylglucosamine 4,6-dehydratase/5-epimerase
MNRYGKTVLITGGTGSFGHACVAHLLCLADVARVWVYSRSEMLQYEMRRKFPDPRLEFFLGDVRDRARLQRAFETVPDLVIHAAALKQVPACEHDPFEALKTNVLGAANVIDAAVDAGVDRVVALSTDKAASALNAYGKSKAMAESLFVRGNAYVGPRRTRFAVVRYGNVIGSRGSVVPLFLDAARTGQTIPITDRRMTRFWMPLASAVELVLYAAETMQGGEVFVPEIPSAYVVDIASRIAPNCPFEETGLRAGEKLHETLISEDEAPQTVWRRMPDGSRVFVIEPVNPSWPYASRGTFVGDGFRYRSDSSAALSRTLPRELQGAA